MLNLDVRAILMAFSQVWRIWQVVRAYADNVSVHSPQDIHVCVISYVHPCHWNQKFAHVTKRSDKLS